MRQTLPSRLKRLEDGLTSLPAPYDALMLSELDGFIAGVLVCPTFIEPIEWLPLIWSQDDEEAAETVEPAVEVAIQAAAALVLQHHDVVSRDLRAGQGRYTPIFDADETGETVFWEFWILGFAKALALKPDSWEAVFESQDEDAVAALTGLIVLVSKASPDGSDIELDDAVIGEITDEALDLIPEWIGALHDWRVRQGKTPPLRSSKVGRNDPCPCGSGKKYKKCCALA